jgi:hypothetical protein
VSIENQLTLILAGALLGVVFAFSLVIRGIARLVRGPQTPQSRPANLDDALPGRSGALREHAGRAASATGTVAIYVIATVAEAAKRSLAWLNYSRKHIHGSVTLGLVAPGPALIEVLRETSSATATAQKKVA